MPRRGSYLIFFCNHPEYFSWPFLTRPFLFTFLWTPLPLLPGMTSRGHPKSSSAALVAGLKFAIFIVPLKTQTPEVWGWWELSLALEVRLVEEAGCREVVRKGRPKGKCSLMPQISRFLFFFMLKKL